MVGYKERKTTAIAKKVDICIDDDEEEDEDVDNSHSGVDDHEKEPSGTPHKWDDDDNGKLGDDNSHSGVDDDAKEPSWTPTTDHRITAKLQPTRPLW